jgi:hypothetical protein
MFKKISKSNNNKIKIIISIKHVFVIVIVKFFVCLGNKNNAKTKKTKSKKLSDSEIVKNQLISLGLLGCLGVGLSLYLRQKIKIEREKKEPENLIGLA